MVGLVFIDKLRLTPAQWAALGLNAAGWLWHVCHSRVDASRPPSQEAFWLTAGLTFSALWTAFWNTPTCVDAWLLFQEAQHFAASGWGALLAELPQRPYVNYQTPFLTFWFSRAPALWFHQLIWFPLALLCAGLMQQLYGRAAALLLATPVFALMIHQPSPDVLLFAVLLIVLRLRQMGQRGLAAWVYGLTWLLKPLTILTAPLILPQLGLAGLGSLAMWGGYVLWSQQWEFGRQQCRFLLQQVFLQSLLNPGGRNNQRMPLTPGSETPEEPRDVLADAGVAVGSSGTQRAPGTTLLSVPGLVSSMRLAGDRFGGCHCHGLRQQQRSLAGFAVPVSSES